MHVYCTLTEKMFPVWPVGTEASCFLVNGSHTMAFRSSDPDTRRLGGRREGRREGREGSGIKRRQRDGGRRKEVCINMGMGP